MPERTYSGKILSVDRNDHTVRVKSWFLSQKDFNLGANCAYDLAGINNGTVADLRPGQEVTVRYQELHGVRIADRVDQEAMKVTGMVTAINPGARTLTVRRNGGFDETLAIGSGCNVLLRDHKQGTLNEIQPGDQVTVTYETPEDHRVAREISQTSREFTGQLTAIDLDKKIVKAKAGSHTVEFNLADNCAIVVNGQLDGKLNELRPDERLMFDYHTVNGVNVVNRIAPAPEGQRGSMANNSHPASPGYPGYVGPAGF
jgi:predicted RNA-binding protein